MMGPLARAHLGFAIPVGTRPLAPRHVWDGDTQAVPIAGGPCAPDDCGRRCWWEDGWYRRDATIGSVDVEAFCLCEHHETDGYEIRQAWMGFVVEREGRQVYAHRT